MNQNSSSLVISLNCSAKLSGFVRFLAFCIALIFVSSSLSLAQPTVPQLAERDPARALTGLAAQVVAIRRIFIARTDLDGTQKAAIKLRLDKINEAVGRLRAIQPRIKSEETPMFASAISEDATFLSGLADVPAAELNGTLDALIDDLSAKAATRTVSGAYGAQSRMVAVKVAAIAIRNNQKVPQQGLTVGAVTMARSKLGCLDKRFGRLTSQAVERLFSGAYRFCIFDGTLQVGSAQWIAIGLDGKPTSDVEVRVP